MYKSALLLAATTVGQTVASGVNVYFGQQGFTDLTTYCSGGGFEYVTIAFVNVSPENDKSGAGFPGTNFAGHCAADVYKNPANSEDSLLLSSCTYIADGIEACQGGANGTAPVKVMLSIGGQWNPPVTDYTVSTAANGIAFAEFMWGAYGPFDPSWTGPRPFDFNGKHIQLDGFDFDLEHAFSEFSYCPYFHPTMLT
jgi:chitinase